MERLFLKYYWRNKKKKLLKTYEKNVCRYLWKNLNLNWEHTNYDLTMVIVTIRFLLFAHSFHNSIIHIIWCPWFFFHRLSQKLPNTQMSLSFLKFSNFLIIVLNFSSRKNLLQSIRKLKKKKMNKIGKGVLKLRCDQGK